MPHGQKEKTPPSRQWALLKWRCGKCVPVEAQLTSNHPMFLPPSSLDYTELSHQFRQSEPPVRQSEPPVPAGHQLRQATSSTSWNLTPLISWDRQLWEVSPFRWSHQTRNSRVKLRVDTKFRDTKFRNKKLFSYFAKLLYYFAKFRRNFTDKYFEYLVNSSRVTFKIKSDKKCPTKLCFRNFATFIWNYCYEISRNKFKFRFNFVFSEIK
jgi:hypothetical protein